MKTSMLLFFLFISLVSCKQVFEENELPTKQLREIAFEGEMDSMGLRHPVSMEFYYVESGNLDLVIAKGVHETGEYQYHYNNDGSVKKIVRVGSLDTTQRHILKYEYKDGELVSINKYSMFGLYSYEGDLEFDMGRNTRFIRYRGVSTALKSEEQYLFEYDRKGNLVHQEIFFSNDEGSFDLVRTYHYRYDNKKNPLKGYQFFGTIGFFLYDTSVMYNTNNICGWTREWGGRTDEWEINYTYKDGYPIKGVVPGDESLNRTFTYY